MEMRQAVAVECKVALGVGTEWTAVADIAVV